jgi:peptidoglycan-associated lipoprotein
MDIKPLFIASAAIAALAGCASTPPPAQLSANQTAVSPAAPVSASASMAQSAAADPLLDPNSPLAKRSVYFDFNSSQVKTEYQTTVASHAEYLTAHTDHKIVIQGNTDAHGSKEYNLALGQRRAEAVKKAMEVLGVPEKQLEAVSFGKEKPQAQGNTEADDAQNRRADLVY